MGSNPTLSAINIRGEDRRPVRTTLIGRPTLRSTEAPMRKAQTVFAVLFLLTAACLSSPGAASQGRPVGKRPAALCPDPTVRCRTSVEFAPHQLPFVVPRNVAIFETEKFYAVILKSRRDTTQDCTGFVPESERLEAQKLFPHNKVFASRCFDPE